MRGVLLALLAACPGPAPAPPSSGAAPPAPPPPDAALAVADAREPTDDERLAAIQKAMNELDEGVQACWALVAARERFDIEGELRAMIDIAPDTAAVSYVHDTVRNAGLSACVTTLLQAYPWAPPLHGQTIQLPFRWTAPDGQNVVDRNLVSWNGQGKVAVAVLLDAASSGNDAASLFELAIQAGGATGMRTAERAEVWYFLGPATVAAANGKKQTVAAGDMMWVPKGGARDVAATAGDVHAMIAMLPGGREGTARAGALPTPALASVRAAPIGATVVAGASAKTYGPATIYIEQKAFAASVLALPAGAQVAEHVHANETELLYLLEGTGTMTVKGVALAVTPTSVVQIPPSTKHAFTATTAVRAVQIYTPGGPEQRFKQAKKP